MRIVVDTHALLWFLLGDERLSLRARAIIEDPSLDVCVRAASAWEIATKFRIGKLPQSSVLVLSLNERVRGCGMTPIAITFEHARTAGLLASRHRDPFDRLIFAQALVERMAWVGNETVSAGEPVARIW